MQTYSGKWMPRFNVLIVGLCGFGTFYFMVIASLQRALQHHDHAPALLIAALPFGLFGLLLGSYSLYAIVDSFSIYQVDADGITKRGQGRVISLYWRSLTAFRYSGLRNSILTLHDDSGQKLNIDFELIHDPQGTLRAALDVCLNPIRERQQQELQWREKTFRPLRGLSTIIIPFVFLLIGFGAALLFDPHMVSGSPTEKTLLSLVFISGGLIFILFGIQCFTWTLTVSRDAIASDSLFRHRRIPFARIEELLSRTVARRNGPTRITTIIGAGQRISFTDAMPDYALVCDYIAAHTDPQAAARGSAGLPAREAREFKQGLITVAVIASFCMGLMALLFIVPARQRLARQDSLDAHGVTVAGHLTGVHVSGRKTPVYYLDYEFPLNGQTHRDFGSVPQNIFDVARPSQSIAVTYLPDDPTINRPTHSNARMRADDLLHEAYRLIAMMAVVSLIMLGYALFSQAKSKRVPTS